MEEKKLFNKQIKFSFSDVIVAILILTLLQTLIGNPFLSKQKEIAYS